MIKIVKIHKMCKIYILYFYRLMNTKDSFKDKIMKYSSRIGLKNNQKIFVMNSKDGHVRDALVKGGWVEGDIGSGFFHLKWVYTDNLQDYPKLQCKIYW